jgi:hypothetical protein
MMHCMFSCRAKLGSAWPIDGDSISATANSSPLRIPAFGRRMTRGNSSFGAGRIGVGEHGVLVFIVVSCWVEVGRSEGRV